jgi:hypothetical protein
MLNLVRSTRQAGGEAMTDSADGRSPLAIAMQWAARIMTVSLEMVIPGFLGLWLDQYLGTRLLFAVIGFAFGLVGGMWHLVQMARMSADSKQASGPRDDQRDTRDR